MILYDHFITLHEGLASATDLKRVGICVYLYVVYMFVYKTLLYFTSDVLVLCIHAGRAGGLGKAASLVTPHYGLIMDSPHYITISS